MKDNAQNIYEEYPKTESLSHNTETTALSFFSQKLEQDIMIDTECSDMLQPYMGIGNTGWMKHGGWSRGDW